MTRGDPVGASNLMQEVDRRPRVGDGAVESMRKLVCGQVLVGQVSRQLCEHHLPGRFSFEQKK